MKATLLPDRGVIKLTGAEARSFLNGLVTADLNQLTDQQARYAALLTPQGKIIVDFIMSQVAGDSTGGIYLDCPRALASTLATRLNFYKLRAKIAVEDLSDSRGVLALWDGLPAPDAPPCHADPRLPALGFRAIVDTEAAADEARRFGADLVDPESYEKHRIILGVPRGGADFIYGDAFPHEADMDQLGGVDFDKGCYVGQEVVSRMQHRGTARTRIVSVTYADFPPEAGTPIEAGGKSVGTMGSGTHGRGLAMLRLDRAADARAAGTPLMAGGIELQPLKQEWARFEMPSAT